MTKKKPCVSLQNIINLVPSHETKFFVIPDRYFLRCQEETNKTEIILSKLETCPYGMILLVHIWKSSFDKVLGFDISPENTELLFYTNSQIHIYSFFNEIIENVKQIDFRNLIPNQMNFVAKDIIQVLPIHCTLQTAQFIVCFQDKAMFYFIVDINKDVVQTYVELTKAQCCAWNMEYIHVLTSGGILCKYNTLSGVLISEDFNIYSIIPKHSHQVQFKHMRISCNNKDACVVDSSGSVYLFQIEEDRSDIETGLDISMELGVDSVSPSQSRDNTSSKKWSFLQKIIKKNEQSPAFVVDSSPVQSTSSVSVLKDIIPDVTNMNCFSVEFLTQGLAIWTKERSGDKYSRDKGDLLSDYQFKDISCLLIDPTEKHKDQSYQFIASEQSIFIPIGSTRAREIFTREMEASKTIAASKWGHFLSLISDKPSPLNVNTTIIEMVHSTYQYHQLDILDYCIRSHLDLFTQDICETSPDMVASSSTNADVGEASPEMMASSSTNADLLDVGEDSPIESRDELTSIKDKSEIKPQLLNSQDSIHILDQILQIATCAENRSDLAFFAACLERLMNHLVDLVKLCNDRDSRNLSFQILKKIPPLLAKIPDRPIGGPKWDCLAPTQSLYLSLHSPHYNADEPVPRHLVMTLVEECIDNRDFPQVESVLNKVGYNIQDELKTVFSSTLSQPARDFILNHVTNDLLTQDELEAYLCYKDIHKAYTKLVEKVSYGETNKDCADKTCDNTDDTNITWQTDEKYDEPGKSSELLREYDADKVISDDEGCDISSLIEDSKSFVERNYKIGTSIESSEDDVREGVTKVKSGSVDDKPNILTISFGEFFTYTTEHKMEMIALLYFKSYDDSLVKYLNKDVCWKHMVENNMLADLDAWISGSASWNTEQWNITQVMIDQVHTLNATPATKEFILNQFCAVYGIFSSIEKSNILNIVSRLVKCELLSKVEQVLGYSTSNVTYEYFMTQLILHCIQREHWTLLSSLLENTSFSDLPLETRALSPVKLWSYLNQTFVSPNLPEQDLLHLVSNVADILDCHNEPSVEISKYFIRANIPGEQETSGKQDKRSICDESFGQEGNDETTVCDTESGSERTKISGSNTQPGRCDSKSQSGLLSCSNLYKTALTPPCISQDISLSVLVQNNPSIDFPSVLARTYSSMRNKSANFNLNFLDHMKQRRPIFTFYESSDLNLNEMHALVLNNPRDSSLVASALCVMNLLNVDAACLATQVRGMRLLTDEDIVDLLANHYKFSSSSLMNSIIRKSASHCSDLKSWSPVVDLCRLYKTPMPEELFEILIRKNQWMEFLIACDVFDCADGDKLIHRFKNPHTRQHLKYALGSTLGHTDSAHSQLMDVIESCHSNPESLLEAGLAHANPCLAILAASVYSESQTPSQSLFMDNSQTPLQGLFMDNQTLCKCLRVYLLACLDIREDEKEWSLIQIMGMAVERKCLALLEDGVQMLFPDSALAHYLSALCNFVMFDGQQTLDKMKTSIAIILSSTTTSQSWTVDAIVCLTHKALSLLSSFAQLELLSTLEEAGFASIQTGQIPLSTVLQKAACLQRTDIYLNFTQLWPEPSGAYQKSILTLLIERKLFEKAQEFCALCDLCTDQIILAQWTDLISQEKYTTDLEFWKSIDEDFRKNSITNEDGFEFFTRQSERIKPPVDKYKCLKLGLERSSTCYPDLYRRLYFLCIDNHFDLSQLNDCWSFNPTVSSHDVSRRSSYVKPLPDGNGKPTDDTTGVKLTSKHHTSDHDTDVQLTPDKHGKPTDDTTSVKLTSKHHTSGHDTDVKLSPDKHHARLNLLITSMLDIGDLYNASLISRLFSWEHSDCLVLEQMAKATTQHESGEDVLVQLANLTMSEILSLEPSSILNRICDTDLPMQCVQDLVCLANTGLSQSDIAQVIASVIYSTLEDAVSTSLVLWGYDLNMEFSRFVSLCDATELGLCLYYKAKAFLATEEIPDEILRQIVELLIRSHDCFTSACNMEGVVSVLDKCRHLVVHLLAQSAWSLMVRLLTGIGRYVEMNYIYQLLKENQQFEFLLRKGYDKNPSFKLATLDFVRGDKNLFELVALNFRLYAELATMFESDANAMVAKLEMTSEGRLVCNENNKVLLKSIIDNYSHAAQHFIEAQKLKQATSIVNQAELMSLQLDLLNASMPGSVDCLALYAIPAKDLTNTIAYHLTYQQAMVVMNSYDMPVDWSLVLYVQCVLQGNRSYLTTWLTNHRLSSNIIQDIASRYQKEPKPSASMTSHMKYLVSQVKPLELKYRLCSQLNFKDILHSIIINPDVALLKDTVWQVGYKQKGGLK
ncbi:hypothetical protein M8J76_015496 [Diaphorina citri]|nr:hypothetical protein M8J76_015496 [Diaphorina citri]